MGDVIKTMKELTHKYKPDTEDIISIERGITDGKWIIKILEKEVAIWLEEDESEGHWECWCNSINEFIDPWIKTLNPEDPEYEKDCTLIKHESLEEALEYLNLKRYGRPENY
jgi:hypothetical protein